MGYDDWIADDNYTESGINRKYDRPDTDEEDNDDEQDDSSNERGQGQHGNGTTRS